MSSQDRIRDLITLTEICSDVFDGWGMPIHEITDNPFYSFHEVNINNRA
jgi:hypothetical protein